MAAGNSAQFTIVFTALDKATATMRNINKSIGGLSTPFTDIGRRLTALAEETGLTTLGERAAVVGEKFGALGHQIGGLLGPLAALGAAGTAAGLFEMAKGAAEFGKQLYVAQQRTGVSADALAKLHFAGSTVGLEADQMDLSIERLNRTIAQTASGRNKQAAQLFREMHISLFNTNGKLKDAITLLPELSKHFAANASIAQKTNAAMMLMGRSGAQMLPLFEMGGDEMKKLFGTFEQMYGKITPEVLKSAREGSESFEVLKLAVHGLSFTIGSALFPVLKDLITPITAWVATNRTLVAQNVKAWVTGVANAMKNIDWSAVGSAIMGVVHAFETLGRVLGPFWSTMAVAGVIFSPFVTGAFGAAIAIGRFGFSLAGVGVKIAAFAVEGLPSLMVGLAALTETVLPALSGAFLSLGIAIEATPIGWIITGIAAVAAAGYLLYRYWTPIAGFFASLWGGVKAVFSDAGTAIALLIPGGTLVQNIMTNWRVLPQFFVGLWNDVKPTFTWLKNFALGVTDYAVDYLKARWAPVAGFFSALWKRASAAFTWLKFFAIGVSDYAVQGIKAVWRPVSAFFAGVWSGIVSAAQSAWQGISGFFSGVWDGIKQVFVWGWNNIVPWIPGLNLVKIIIDNWSSIPRFFRSLWAGVTSIFETMWQKLKPIIETVVGGAKWLAEHTGLLDAYNVASKVTHVVVHEVVHAAQRVGSGFEKIEERGEALTRLGNVARLSNLIARGEGTYNSVNLGQRGGYRADTVPLGNMTLAQVMAAQGKHQFNAAGRYQIITATLRDAVSRLHLNTGAKFDAGMQDRIFKQYLLGMKHPEIANYLARRNNDVMSAARAASAEWASVADPRTGKSHYAGVGNNKASISVAEIVAALRAARVPSDASRIPAISRPVVDPRGGVALSKPVVDTRAAALSKPIISARPASGGQQPAQKSQTDVNIHVKGETTKVTSRSTGGNPANVTVDRGKSWAS